MKKRICLVAGFLIFLTLLILSFSFASASFLKGNATAKIQKTYSSEEVIKGWINISLKNESFDSLIEADDSDFEGSIKLKDFLEKNYFSAGEDFYCIPEDCGYDYKATGGETSKTFSLSASQEKILGFRVTGENVNINNLSFKIQSDVSSSCSSQLEIDILDDDIIDWKNQKFLDELCLSKNYGCFRDVDVSQPVLQNIFCEKIALQPSAAFELGAWIKKELTPFTGDLLKMRLYKDDEKKAECNLFQPSDSGAEISCKVNYSVKETGNYFVCLFPEDETDYKIKAEASSPKCGFNDYPVSSFTADYQIFAQPYKYDSIGTLNFNEKVFESLNDASLINYADDYIDEKYGRNCSNGCVIPVKFKAMEQQQIIISNVKISYDKKGMPGITENRAYNIERKEPKINSGFLKFDLEKSGIKVPSPYRNYTLRLNLDDVKIAEEKISVLNVPVLKRIIPSEVPQGALVEFTIETGGRNLTASRYDWDFGDETGIMNSTSKKITHVYEETGNYVAKVTMKTSLGDISQKFNISVFSAKEIANITIADYKKRINRIEVAIQGKKYAGIVKKAVEFDDLKSKIESLEKKYSQSSSTEEYGNIMLNLTMMNVPLAFNKTSVSDLRFFNEPDKINLDYIAEIEGTEIKLGGDVEKVKKALTGWLAENFDARLKQTIYSLVYTDRKEEIVNNVEFTINSKKTLSYDSFLIIDAPQENLVFDEGRKVKEGTYINLKEISQSIKVDFVVDLSKESKELSIYVSPELKKIGLAAEIFPCNYNEICESDLQENSKNCRTDCKPYGWMILWIFIVLTAALIIYVILQEWYKRNYQNSLFKNSADLYNLISFIDNARKQGLSDSLIKEKLRKSNWSNEQINYAIRKYEGKRTGMWEIPVFKWFENKKVKQEIEKRQQKKIM